MREHGNRIKIGQSEKNVSIFKVNLALILYCKIPFNHTLELHAMNMFFSCMCFLLSESPVLQCSSEPGGAHGTSG